MEDSTKNFDVETIGANLLKGKKGRPKKEAEPTTTIIWVVTSILGVEAAFVDEAALKEYALGYNKLGLNSMVWKVEDGKSTKIGHITNFKK